jgi:hypothetical protein
VFIQSRIPTTPEPIRNQPKAEAQAGPVDQVQTSAPSDMTALDRLREYASKPIQTKSVEVPVQPLNTQPPDANSWPTLEDIKSTLDSAATNVPEKVKTGATADRADEYIKRQITKFQARKAEAEGSKENTRLVHREQLHGGGAELHWNPNMNQLLNLFDKDTQQGLVRISDAAANANPDGKTMYGFALELFGRGNQPTDILLTGGTALTEKSQAKSPEAQLALFNMLNPPSKLGGIANILMQVGPLDGPKMLVDVAKMRTNLESLTDLTAFSRVPFALQGKDGKEYLIKMRVAPTGSPAKPPGEGSTTSEKLENGLKQTLEQGEARWKLEFQFMQPGDDPHDPRKTWNGPWLAAAEVVLPQTNDRAEADRLSQVAEDTKFYPWKGKDPLATGPDKNVLRPWGELNRARLAAYQASINNRSYNS